MAIDNDNEEWEEEAFVNDMANFDHAIGEAKAELNALTQAASTADQLAANGSPDYSLHAVPGMGRYAVPRRSGWRALLKIIHTLSANIDFSYNDYPSFDRIIGEHFASPYLLDPLNEKYESYRDLRDNIAAVRNFLMETYYVDTPAGMTPEKAKKAMEEIAAFIGDGLNNNNIFAGIIRNHDSSKPFISLSKASEPGGEGAQYIYEKILEMHRHSNWTRPFSAIISFFGGHVAQDWMLPPAHTTEFTDFLEHDIADKNPANGPPPAALEKEIEHVNALEAARTKRMDRYLINLVANDLNAIGNHLFRTVNNLQEVKNLSENVRAEAVDIARDILRKLKVSLGDINIMDGLKLPPTDDVATLGGIKGVAIVYERMVNWARSNDPRIMQDASVIAGIQAIGKMGYLAKLEALRMAKMAGNTTLVDKITNQLSQIPEVYTTKNGPRTFGELLDNVEAGMNAILNRVQTLSGPGVKLGLAANELGSGGVNSAPTAGQGGQMSLSKPVENTAIALNKNLVTATQAQQTKTVTTQTKATNWERPTLTQNGPARPNMSTITSAKQPRPSRATTASPTTPNPANNAQRQQAMRVNFAHLHDHEHEEHEHQLQQIREAQRIAALKAAQKAAVKTADKNTAAKAAAAKAVAGKIDPNILTQFQTNMNTTGLTGPAVNPGGEKKNYVNTVTKPPVTNVPPDEKHLYPPQLPPNRGGRGF